MISTLRTYSDPQFNWGSLYAYQMTVFRISTSFQKLTRLYERIIVKIKLRSENMAFQKLLIRLRSKTNQYLGWFPPTITRLSLGLLFTGTGWGKVHNLDHVTEYFTSLNIPFPAFNAYLVGFTELICGSLLILGLFTRFASIPLIISMIVALMTAKADEISTFNDLASLTEYLYIILLLWLVVQGPGPVSLDRIISKRLDQSS